MTMRRSLLCHKLLIIKNRFLVVAKTREGALELLDLVIDQGVGRESKT